MSRKHAPCECMQRNMESDGREVRADRHCLIFNDVFQCGLDALREGVLPRDV